MLRRMDSAEITEWRAYFALRHEQHQNPGKARPATGADIRAMFAHRVKKQES